MEARSTKLIQGEISGEKFNKVDASGAKDNKVEARSKKSRQRLQNANKKSTQGQQSGGMVNNIKARSLNWRQGQMSGR